MKRIALLPVLLILNFLAKGQSDTVTLFFCYGQAEKTYPLSRQTDMLARSNVLKIKNLNKNYLPELNLNGNASYQSDVTQFTPDLPPQFSFISFPQISHDQYKVMLDVNQYIYDGSVTSYDKKIESYNLQSDQQTVQVELYQVKERINQSYFAILFYQETIGLLQSTRDQLVATLREVNAEVAAGASLTSNAEAIQAEIMRTDQQIIEAGTDKNAAFDVLSQLISTVIPNTSNLVLPDLQVSVMPLGEKRPEIILYNTLQSRTLVYKDKVNTRWNPKFSAYGEAGFGRPGLNFLSNDFKPWWLVGARLTWNIWNWGLNANEKKIFDIQKDIIGTQKETFQKNQGIEASQNLADISKASELLVKDQDIISLRAKITQSASSQLTNGVVTSSFYIDRLKEETQARLTQQVHKIQLVKAKINYLFTLGKL